MGKGEGDVEGVWESREGLRGRQRARVAEVMAEVGLGKAADTVIGAFSACGGGAMVVVVVQVAGGVGWAPPFLCLARGALTTYHTHNVPTHTHTHTYTNVHTNTQAAPPRSTTARASRAGRSAAWPSPPSSSSARPSSSSTSPPAGWTGGWVGGWVGVCIDAISILNGWVGACLSVFSYGGVSCLC